MMKYTKKPVTIEAIQWTGKNFTDCMRFIDRKNICPADKDGRDKGILYIHTMEGVMTASTGDFIIKGVKGEFYPCKPDIFEATYSEGESDADVKDVFNSVDTLIKALEADQGFYYAWQANIAMAFQDEFSRQYDPAGIKKITPELLHTISNEAAKNFLNLLIENPNHTISRDDMDFSKVPQELLVERINGLIQIYKPDTNIISDGYHTFGELYEHRIVLYIAFCKLKQNKAHVWRSKVHSDGSVWDGWFILGVYGEPGKQITYHLPMDKWDECDFAFDLEKAPTWDGHTSADVLKRLKNL